MTVRHTFTDLMKHGFDFTLCSPDYWTDESAAQLWYILFALSKLPELGDTAFVILRKQPLILLHWSHHALTLVATWRGLAVTSPVGRYSIVLNLCVHALMYSYYALRSARVRIPRAVSMLITGLQLAQMFVMMGVLIRARLLTVEANTNTADDNRGCHNDLSYIDPMIGMYLYYFALFFKFFYDAYIRGNFRNKPKTHEKFH